jgi:hypothetical protein
MDGFFSATLVPAKTEKKPETSIATRDKRPARPSSSPREIE